MLLCYELSKSFALVSPTLSAIHFNIGHSSSVEINFLAVKGGVLREQGIFCFQYTVVITIFNFSGRLRPYFQLGKKEDL